MNQNSWETSWNQTIKTSSEKNQIHETYKSLCLEEMELKTMNVGENLQTISSKRSFLFTRLTKW